MPKDDFAEGDGGFVPEEEVDEEQPSWGEIGSLLSEAERLKAAGQLTPEQVQHLKEELLEAIPESSPDDVAVRIIEQLEAIASGKG